jgi:hypothetical protein
MFTYISMKVRTVNNIVLVYRYEWVKGSTALMLLTTLVSTDTCTLFNFIEKIRKKGQDSLRKKSLYSIGRSIGVSYGIRDI